MRLRCPNCNTLIPATNLNLERTIAVCPKCDEVFNFGDRVPTRKAKPTGRKVKQPDDVQLSETVDALKIQWRFLPYHRWGRLFSILGAGLLILVGLAIFALPFYNLLTISWTKTPGGDTIFYPARMEWLGVLLLVLSVGIPSLWAGIMTLFGSRQIVLDDRHLTDIYRPIPSFRRKFHRGDILGVLAQVNTQVTSGGRRYDVDVRLRDGTQRPFLTGLRAERAEFIVQELTRYLTQADAEEFVSDELMDEAETSAFDIESQDDDTQADKLHSLQEIEPKSQGLRQS